ncbi:THUMP domain-containing 3 [Pelobates cultripes]|uniref:THUMP domain-containing 3 n=1 Tax=Pelobates cultripes TaxID=61616 RepID=A0AAD1WL34_PELCU|nr:THUMP domain-containing 3 [Pelobates cultripes]
MAEIALPTDNLSEVKLGDSDLMPSNIANLDSISITIGATVPTGFELTAAAEVQEKLGCVCKISKDRGKIYFEIKQDSLGQVHRLRSVDNLFVIVQEFSDFPFKETKESALEDLMELAAKLPWDAALNAWELNNSLKKKKRRKKPGNGNHKEQRGQVVSSEVEVQKEEGSIHPEKEHVTLVNLEKDEDRNLQTTTDSLEIPEKEDTEAGKNQDKPVLLPDPTEVTGEETANDQAQTIHLHGSSQESKDTNTLLDSGVKVEAQEGGETTDSTSVLKFRVTCNRAGDKHSFTSNEAARDFGGAVQDHFQWKADMTNFDIEVLLNISYNEVVVGIALTEESLHRRNITHFGPTTLRSTLAYGMLRLCNLQPSDVIIDPMCGTGSIPLEGVSEWPNCFFMAGDNNPQAVNRAASNINSLLRKQKNTESASQGLPIDAIQWDISRLPLRSSSVDVIVTDMPFGKRIGSKKKNWDLYPACLKEMSRVCRAGTGRAVLLTHDRKCFVKALAKAAHTWKKIHTVWVNIGGLHAGVYLLQRTALDASECTTDKPKENLNECPVSHCKEEEPPAPSDTI